MKITCLDKQVGQFLKESFYRIPRFQRPYSWDRTNIEEFWNDAVVENEAQYFIGNFVVYDDKGAMGVVDGQQRLTTITLLLCALRNAFQNEGFSNLAKGVHGLIERTDISDQRFFVLQTETSYPYFQEHIQKFDGKPGVPVDAAPEEQLLKQAFEYFQSNVNGLVSGIKSLPSLSDTKKKAKLQEELSKIRDKILSLKLIFTALENDDDAYVIFETLNTRGKDLTLSDLVKSHLSRLLKPSNTGVDLAKDKWNKIHNVFEASQADLSVSTFIHHFWLSRYEYITEKKLFKALRKRIKKEDASSFLDDLVTESVIYRYIHEPSSRTWAKDECDIRDSLRAMNLFRIKQQLPLVLSVMRHYEDKALKTKHVCAILSAIENFHFTFTAIASQRSSGGISFMYALAARELYQAKNLEAKVKGLQTFQKKKLAAKQPQYAEFEPSFLELKYSSQMTKQKNLVRYILTNIYQKNSKGLPIDPEQATIEHLASENPAKSTSLSQEDIASIGNLILVNQALNNELANKSFSEKVNILKNANVWIDPVILKAKQWGGPEIAQRTKLLAKEAYDNVWSL
ncbi:MAG: DUF262 domain-containing HNH endonuclease family protein [Acidobacteriia bacterium]|nr:DUF262 domain-containing HNH endonuclease family protein [Terriglobia bacterium]